MIPKRNPNPFKTHSRNKAKQAGDKQLAQENNYSDNRRGSKNNAKTTEMKKL